MLTRSEFVARVIVLRFLLVKKMVSIKTAHALYRDNGTLSKNQSHHYKDDEVKETENKEYNS